MVSLMKKKGRLGIRGAGTTDSSNFLSIWCAQRSSETWALEERISSRERTRGGEWYRCCSRTGPETRSGRCERSSLRRSMSRRPSTGKVLVSRDLWNNWPVKLNERDYIGYHLSLETNNEWWRNQRTCKVPLVKCMTTALDVRNHWRRNGKRISSSPSRAGIDAPALIKFSCMYDRKYANNFIFFSSTTGYTSMVW